MLAGTRNEMGRLGEMALFIAMNHFSVDPERGADFEAHWSQREITLAGVPVSVSFAFLLG